MVITATHVHPLQTPHATLASYDLVEARVDADGRICLHSF
jgi:sugar-phosphatase